MTAQFCYVLLVLGAIAIGAWLVVQGHPVFGALIILIGASTTMTHRKE